MQHNGHLGFEPITMTVKTAVAATGMTRSQLFALIARGSIDTVKVGRRRLIKTSSLREFLGVKAA